jgi:heterotetrameric sarcosine oxidase delta subunit
MIRLPCPHCGVRNASEFRYLGEERERPEPATTTPPEWRTYLYRRANPAGWTTETWHHSVGCRAFFTVERHTVTNEIRSCKTGGHPRTPGDAGAHRP